jgi:hypothetical protein
VIVWPVMFTDVDVDVFVRCNVCWLICPTVVSGNGTGEPVEVNWRSALAAAGGMAAKASAAKMTRRRTERRAHVNTEYGPFRPRSARGHGMMGRDTSANRHAAPDL